MISYVRERVQGVFVPRSLSRLRHRTYVRHGVNGQRRPFSTVIRLLGPCISCCHTPNERSSAARSSLFTHKLVKRSSPAAKKGSGGKTGLDWPRSRASIRNTVFVPLFPSLDLVIIYPVRYFTRWQSRVSRLIFLSHATSA